MPWISRASASTSPPTGTQEEVAVTITDDGPGFAPEIMDRIGEPYVTNSRRRRMNVDGVAGGGLGLGFFIAKTLLERSGATLTYENRKFAGARRDGPGALGP